MNVGTEPPSESRAAALERSEPAKEELKGRP